MFKSLVYNPITSEIYLFAYGVEVFLLRKELEKKSSKTSFVVALVLGFIIRFYRKSIYLPTAWYFLIAKSTQKPGGFRIPPRPPQTSRGTPLHPRHLAVCRQFNFNHDIFTVYFGKNKVFVKALN